PTQPPHSGAERSGSAHAQACAPLRPNSVPRVITTASRTQIQARAVGNPAIIGNPRQLVISFEGPSRCSGAEVWITDLIGAAAGPCLDVIDKTLPFAEQSDFKSGQGRVAVPKFMRTRVFNGGPWRVGGRSTIGPVRCQPVIARRV